MAIERVVSYAGGRVEGDVSTVPPGKKIILNDARYLEFEDSTPIIDFSYLVTVTPDMVFQRVGSTYGANYGHLLRSDEINQTNLKESNGILDLLNIRKISYRWRPTESGEVYKPKFRYEVSQLLPSELGESGVNDGFEDTIYVYEPNTGEPIYSFSVQGTHVKAIAYHDVSNDGYHYFPEREPERRLATLEEYLTRYNLQLNADGFPEDAPAPSRVGRVTGRSHVSHPRRK